MNRLKFLCNDDKYSFYLFEPQNTELFWNQCYPYGKSFIQICRFLSEKARNYYQIYYMFSDSEMVGFCVVHTGGGRYHFVDKRDLMIGPYFIDVKWRGKGLSVKLLKAVVWRFLPRDRDVYDYINITNIPSLRASEAIGMTVVNGISINHFTHRMTLSQIGQSEFLLYKYPRSGEKDE